MELKRWIADLRLAILLRPRLYQCKGMWHVLNIDMKKNKFLSYLPWPQATGVGEIPIGHFRATIGIQKGISVVV